MLNRWRRKIPEDSIFHNPLVVDITVVLVLKVILLALLWQITFKPLKKTAPLDVNKQFLSTTLAKESHDE